MASTLTGITNTVSDTVSASMKSFTDFLQNGAAKLADGSGILADFVHPSALILLYVVLFVHFFAWALENNGNLQTKWPAFSQSMHELRSFIQQWVLGSAGTWSQGLVYWGSFAMSATVSSSTSSITEDVSYAMYLSLFYAVVFIINQVCMATLMNPGQEVGYTDNGPMFPPGASKRPLLSPTKGKPLWVIVYWVQSITAIVLYNSIRGVTYGYGAGKIVGLLLGNPTSF
jgi:hypothetical protein